MKPKTFKSFLQEKLAKDKAFAARNPHLASGGLDTPRRHVVAVPFRKTRWKQGWRTIGGCRFYARSRWEANYARYLEFLKSAGRIKSWAHEPKTFWFDAIKRGTRSYKPDFLVTPETGEPYYTEVKGWFDARSKTKLKRMAKYHPTVKVVVVGEDWFRSAKNFAKILPGWE